MVRFRTAQKGHGFSIIEMTIAIVILGIVFAMALKGTLFIDTMRAFITGYQLTRFQHAVQSYQAEFNNMLPGDDPNGPLRSQRPPSLTLMSGQPVSFAGNGVIDGQLSDLRNAQGEQYMAWNDLRSFGALGGSQTLSGFSAMPANPFGGVYGFDEGNLGQEKGSLCATHIPGQAAQLIDNRLDDGVIDKGNLVATSRFSMEENNHFNAPDTEPYNIEKEYIICVPYLP